MTKRRRVLILGGTSEATALAARASTLPEVEIIMSLAGRTRQPIDLSSGRDIKMRMGGFGGIAGLTEYLQKQQIDVLIDATHPFAAQISFNAVAAAIESKIPHLMLMRPTWQPMPGDRWIEVASNEAAVTILPNLGQRIFLTIGRQELATFAALQNLWFLMRMVDSPAPDASLPPGELLLERGPFDLQTERSLLQKYHIEVIVSKNSGGDATYAKIVAARELGLPVVMVQRPPVPKGDRVESVEDALAWINNI
ncbi:MAG TPA: cobalt-precorrin-6A reductase [Allocoleopsis sp.]